MQFEEGKEYISEQLKMKKEFFQLERVISSEVEQLAVNQKVDGSIPSLPFFN